MGDSTGMLHAPPGNVYIGLTWVLQWAAQEETPMSNWIDSVTMLAIVSMFVAWQQLHGEQS